jgi:N utilization substance protein B
MTAGRIESTICQWVINAQGRLTVTANNQRPTDRLDRRPARIVVLQALYELDVTQHPIEQVMPERLTETPLEGELHEFAYAVVKGVLQYRKKLDVVIQQSAPEWPLDQVAVVDRNILRLALYEWAIARQTPMRVAINEAVELAKDFGSESAARFINGVLGTLATKETELVAVLTS